MITLDDIPNDFFELAADEMHRLFPGPALLRRHGSTNRWVFISTLLHGDETTGIGVLQEILARPKLPCSVMALVGNVSAARFQSRRLPNEPDCNRIWANEELQRNPWAQKLLQTVISHKPLATIDIHNSAGRTQPYSVITQLNAEHVYLAQKFSSTVVHFHEPHTTLVSALGQHMPSVAIECGPVESDEAQHEHVVSYIDDILHHPTLGQTHLSDPSLTLYESFARIYAKGDVGYADSTHALNLNSNLDLANLSIVPAGTQWGSIRAGAEFLALDASGQDVTKEYFDLSQGVIQVRKKFVPALLSSKSNAAQDDCLCYMMKLISHH